MIKKYWPFSFFAKYFSQGIFCRRPIFEGEKFVYEISIIINNYRIPRFLNSRNYDKQMIKATPMQVWKSPYMFVLI